MNCIICLDKNPITKDNPLTDEHIVPEFIGGTLTAKNVCKICNSRFGHGFEGRLSNSFIFKLSKQVYNISGKSKKTTSAFSGLYDHPSLGKVQGGIILFASNSHLSSRQKTSPFENHHSSKRI